MTMYLDKLWRATLAMQQAALRLDSIKSGDNTYVERGEIEAFWFAHREAEKAFKALAGVDKYKDA